jgi:hypothetical protein
MPDDLEAIIQALVARRPQVNVDGVARTPPSVGTEEKLPAQRDPAAAAPSADLPRSTDPAETPIPETQ